MKLRPHQEVSRGYLRARERAYLADQPRVGKTPAAIMAARDLNIRHVTVICPASVVSNWRREWKRWWPKFDGQLEVYSYDKLARNNTAMGSPTLVIFDEFHYCKTRSAKRTVASLALLKKARYVWALSGTPAPNHPGELYVPLAALWPMELRLLNIRNADDWMNLTCHWKSIKVGHRTWVPKVFGAKNAPMVKALLDRLMLRRTFKEVSGKDPVWWSEQFIDLTPADTKRVNALAPLDTPIREEDENLARARHELGRLKAPLVAAALADELRDDPTRKIVVVAYHTAVLLALAEALAEFEPELIDGSVSKTARDARVAKFQERPATRVLIGQHKAIREGITLDRADSVEMVELVFTPGDNEQVANRASSTEKPTVPVRAWSVAGTVDEAVNGVIIRKEEMQSEIGL